MESLEKQDRISCSPAPFSTRQAYSNRNKHVLIICYYRALTNFISSASKFVVEVERMFSAANSYGQGSFSDGCVIENGSFCPGMRLEAMASSNSHKEAERRRRKRINSHMATLKSILPNVIKTDKASLLGEAVKRVRELNKAASELSTLNFYIPRETDELIVSRCEGHSDDNSGLVKATLCCEDRPEIVMDLMQALKSVEAKVVRAEMSTLGGRTMSVLWIRPRVDDDSGVATLKRALKNVADKCDHALPVSKRIRHLKS